MAAVKAETRYPLGERKTGVRQTQARFWIGLSEVGCRFKSCPLHACKAVGIPANQGSDRQFTGDCASFPRCCSGNLSFGSPLLRIAQVGKAGRVVAVMECSSLAWLASRRRHSTAAECTGEGLRKPLLDWRFSPFSRGFKSHCLHGYTKCVTRRAEDFVFSSVCSALGPFV